MNQETLTRLGWVIEAVGKAPPRQFNMDYWQRRRWFCGTSHCAIGWACQDERVQASGLYLPVAVNYFVMPRFGNHTGFDAIARWLDIPRSDARQLFGPRHCSGKSKEEVLKRLYAYRDLVSYELARQVPQARPEERKEDAVSIAEYIARGMEPDPVQRKVAMRTEATRMGRAMEERPDETQQAHPAPGSAPMQPAIKASLDASTPEVDPCES